MAAIRLAQRNIDTCQTWSAVVCPSLGKILKKAGFLKIFDDIVSIKEKLSKNVHINGIEDVASCRKCNYVLQKGTVNMVR